MTTNIHGLWYVTADGRCVAGPYGTREAAWAAASRVQRLPGGGKFFAMGAAQLHDGAEPPMKERCAMIRDLAATEAGDSAQTRALRA